MTEAEDTPEDDRELEEKDNSVAAEEEVEERLDQENVEEEARKHEL